MTTDSPDTERTADGLPIGRRLPPAMLTPAPRPSPVSLRGRSVVVDRPDVARDAQILFEAAHGPEREALWLYMGVGPFVDEASFRTWLEQRLADADPYFYALRDLVTGTALGLASLMRIDPANRVIEVGNILFSPRLQRSVAATEAMYLLARYAFELGYRRYEWKCNAHNLPSRRAAERLGFVYEGIFRQHMIIKGRNRDTAWFAMLDRDWPAVQRGFELWLDPANFDPQGRQRKGLAALRAQG